MRRLWNVVLPLMLASLAGCGGRSGDGVVSKGDVIEANGTVVWNVVEGGFYGIKGDDGRSYDPTNLPEAFRTPNLRVRFTARLRADLVSIHMTGPIVDILSIDKL